MTKQNWILLSFILSILLLFCATPLRANPCATDNKFLVGAGIYDVTGPPAEVGMMGYGMIYQRTNGIFQRLWARAFVIESPCNGKRVVFVNSDLGQIFQAVKEEVVKKLQSKYGNKYTRDNVLLSANHTHSGPGGYSTYAFYNITTIGFNHQNFNTIVNGIVKAIEYADSHKQLATIKTNKGDLAGISYNRSKEAYLRNPIAERNRYSSDVDTEMTILRFDSIDGKPIGMISWFPLHGVSLNKENTLISGDNKGVAEYLFEKELKSTYRNKGDFIATFAQSNAGDVSPNLYGQTGKFGEQGRLEVDKVGRAQFEKAKELYQEANETIHGEVDYVHRHYQMDNITVDKSYTDGVLRSTCKAALGISMLAGTQDGEGVGKQGVTCENISNIFSKLACEMVTTPCQREKPIFFTTGDAFPYPWTPDVLPLQIIKIGNFAIVAAPFEIATMAGRRIKQSVKSILKEDNVVLSSLANAYAGYVVTNEEYGLQRYEAASTHFGPWQQAAIQQEFDKLAIALRDHKQVPKGPTPRNLLNAQIELMPGVIFDDKPLNHNFGDIAQDVKPSYKPGETVEATFWGGHPNNNFKSQNSFLEIQQFKNNEWIPIRYDRDFDTEYHWTRNAIAFSLIKIVWHVPKDADKGQYRIVHHGDWKSGWTEEIFPYTGQSSTFSIE